MPPSAKQQRCIGFVDLDAFYAAVEVERDKSLAGKPVAVVQYETWNLTAEDVGADGNRIVTKDTKSGLIAVSYPARAKGVKRHMNAAEARKACPDVVLVRVPTAHGKADLRIYKEAGQRVVDELQKFAGFVVEKRSVDEVAIDVTDAARRLSQSTPKAEIWRRAMACSHLADSEESLHMAKVSHSQSRRGHADQKVRADDADGSSDESLPSFLLADSDDRSLLLLAGAVVVDEARKHVMRELGYSCSAGVASNKLMSKVACGLHKPAQQTIVLGDECARALLRDMPLDRLPGLGGALGKRVVSAFGDTAGDVAATEKSAMLRKGFSAEEADWLLSVVTGTFFEPVKDRTTYQSFGASKTFYSKPLTTLTDLEHWLQQLSMEIFDRVAEDRQKNARAPANVTVSLSDDGQHLSRTEKVSFGWAGTLKTIQASADRLLKRYAGHRKTFNVTCLGLGVSNFEALPQQSTSVLALMQQNAKKAAPSPTMKSPPLGGGGGKEDKSSPVVVDVTSEEDAIDPAVFAELPPEIQAELRDDRKRKQLLADDRATRMHQRPPPPAKKTKKATAAKGGGAQRKPKGGKKLPPRIDAFLPPRTRKED